MRKGTNKERDRELIARLQEEAPEVLSATVGFDALVENVLSDDSDCISDVPVRRKRRVLKTASSSKP
jgi:hypothetical protein